MKTVIVIIIMCTSHQVFSVCSVGTGPLAIAVPGQLRGLQYALQRYGRLPLSDIFAPAIRLASEGFPVSGAIERAIQSNKDILLSNNKTFAALRYVSIIIARYE